MGGGNISCRGILVLVLVFFLFCFVFFFLSWPTNPILQTPARPGAALSGTELLELPLEQVLDSEFAAAQTRSSGDEPDKNTNNGADETATTTESVFGYLSVLKLLRGFGQQEMGAV